MNSTSTFEIAPFGTSHENESEEIRWHGSGGARRSGSAFSHRAGFARHGSAGARGNRSGLARRYRGAGHAYGHSQHSGRLGLHGHVGLRHGLYGHRLARDFRNRLGFNQQPFGVTPPSFAGAGSDAGAPDAGAPPPPAPLAVGGSGSEEQIRWIQSVLNTIQGANLPTDGVPSPDLRAALQTFQGQHGLPVSGFAGPDTIAALQAAAAGGAPAGGAAPAQPDAPPPPADASAGAGGGAAAGASGEFEVLPFRSSL